MNGKQPGLFMSVAYFVIGFSPITALAIAIMGILPLPVTTLDRDNYSQWERTVTYNEVDLCGPGTHPW
jgi:uncharacterized membrane protein